MSAQERIAAESYRVVPKVCSVADSLFDDLQFPSMVEHSGQSPGLLAPCSFGIHRPQVTRRQCRQKGKCQACQVAGAVFLPMPGPASLSPSLWVFTMEKQSCTLCLRPAKSDSFPVTPAPSTAPSRDLRDISWMARCLVCFGDGEEMFLCILALSALFGG